MPARSFVCSRLRQRRARQHPSSPDSRPGDRRAARWMLALASRRSIVLSQTARVPRPQRRTRCSASPGSSIARATLQDFGRSAGQLLKAPCFQVLECFRTENTLSNRPCRRQVTVDPHAHLRAIGLASHSVHRIWGRQLRTSDSTPRSVSG